MAPDSNSQIRTTAYTVKQVAGLSGVSVCTLHQYDEADVLKPVYQTANGYPFYEQPQVLSQQQIRFYRELGFELKQIRDILARPTFEKVKAFMTQREVLEETLARTRTLLQTIDKTAEYLKGGTPMENEELFSGFAVAAGRDQFDEQISLGDDAIHCKLSVRDTDRSLSVSEFTGIARGMGRFHYVQDH